jgi:hypothetical protein
VTLRISALYQPISSSATRRTFSSDLSSALVSHQPRCSACEMLGSRGDGTARHASERLQRCQSQFALLSISSTRSRRGMRAAVRALLLYQAWLLSCPVLIWKPASMAVAVSYMSGKRLRLISSGVARSECSDTFIAAITAPAES